MGSLCSLLMFIVVLAYGYQKFDVWNTKKDIDIQYSTVDSYFTDDDVFDFKEGLNFAMAFTAYDTETEPILDPSIGRIVFNSYSWGGLDENGDFAPALIEEVKTHTCTKEELGLEGKSSAFLPITKNAVPSVEIHQKKFLCIDREELRMYGDYNSDKARLINIQLVRCHDGGYFAENGITCKSQDQITDFLRNKFLLMLYNQKRFAPGAFKDQSIVEEARLLWTMVNTQIRQTIPFKVSKTHVFLQDKDIDLNTITLEDDSTVFKVEPLPIRPQEKDLNVQMEITMEMNLDLAKVSRSGYTFIDVLSDIGGIQSILISTITILISIFNYNHFDDYMATRLFKAKSKGHRSDKDMRNEPTELQPTFYFNSCLYFADLIPKKIRCC